MKNIVKINNKKTFTNKQIPRNNQMKTNYFKQMKQTITNIITQ